MNEDSDRIIDLSESVYKLCKVYPEVKDILAGLGFKDIANPLMLNTAGRIMTIPKGSRIKNIDLDLIISVLEQNGFVVVKGENINE